MIIYEELCDLCEERVPENKPLIPIQVKMIVEDFPKRRITKTIMVCHDCCDKIYSDKDEKIE